MADEARSIGFRPDLSRRIPVAHWFLVALMCVAVYWPKLGATAFSMTEGHRAIPGWEMRDSGQWFAPTLFEQLYLRKPPGMPWAVALSSMIFGESEFSARAVSACAASIVALAALWFGTRWFGSRAGLAAGLAQALWPWMWSSGRAAEIEALNNAGAFLASMAFIDLLVWRDSKARTILVSMIAASGLTITGLAKGPAAWPIIIAVMVGAIIAGAPVKRLFRPALVIPVVAAIAVWGLVAFKIDQAIAASPTKPVLQGPSEFLWRPHKLTLAGIWKVLSMPLVAWLSSMPASLAWLFVWGKQASSEASDPKGVPHDRSHYATAFVIAKALAIGWLGSVLFLAALGVDNPRYAMPCCIILPMLVGYVVHGSQSTFNRPRRWLANKLLINRSGRELGLWPLVLLIGAGVWIFVAEPRARRESARDDTTLARFFPDRAVVLADHLIEARPDTLWYIQRHAQAQGKRLEFRWVPGLATQIPTFPPEAHEIFLILRSDAGSAEAAIARNTYGEWLEKVGEFSGRKFHCEVYRLPLFIREHRPPPR